MTKTAKTTKPKVSRESKGGLNLSAARVEKLVRKGQPGQSRERARADLPRRRDRAAGTQTLAQIARRTTRRTPRRPGHAPTKRVHPADLIKAVRYDPDYSRAFSGFAFGSLKKAAKPINYILPADEAKARRERIAVAKKAAKEAAKEKKGKEAKEAKAKEKAAKKGSSSSK